MSDIQMIPTPRIVLPNKRVIEPREIGKYLTGKTDDGKLVITAEARPWVSINYREARAANKAAGLKLQPDSLRAALAYDAYHQAENWDSGIVGEGSMFMGLHKWTVREAVAATFESPDPAERRWLVLSNGEKIWDLSGNAYEYTEDDVQGDEEGLVAKPFAEDSISICLAPAPSMKKGVGWYPKAGDDWSGYALVRGGYWNSGDFAGAFYLDGWNPEGRDAEIGFRSTK